MRIIVLLLIAALFMAWGGFYALSGENVRLARVFFAAAGVLVVLVIVGFFGLV